MFKVFAVAFKAFLRVDVLVRIEVIVHLGKAVKQGPSAGCFPTIAFMRNLPL
jgi:hypothetical protein